MVQSSSKYALNENRVSRGWQKTDDWKQGDQTQ